MNYFSTPGCPDTKPRVTPGNDEEKLAVSDSDSRFLSPE
jgi:hypothetical protein